MTAAVASVKPDSGTNTPVESSAPANAGMVLAPLHKANYVPA
jgi:hypothetical protein